MTLKEKIDAGMKFFAALLVLALLSAPLIVMHNKIVDFLAELSAQIVKYLSGVS